MGEEKVEMEEDKVDGCCGMISLVWNDTEMSWKHHSVERFILVI